MTSIQRTRFAKMDHRPPLWVDVPTYFITICAKERGQNHFATPVGNHILKSIQIYHEKQRWYCELAVLMPDHVHLLVSFGRDDDFQRVVGDWKRWISRNHATVWQENFFEHRLRKDESLNDKGLYILQNPVRAGLVSKAEDWPYFWHSR